MSILRRSDLDTDERDAYLRYANARRRAENAEGIENGDAPCAPDYGDTKLPESRIVELEANEQFILSVAADGFGKRTSAYEYRTTSRGGLGIGNMDLSRGRGQPASSVVAAFPIEAQDQIMLVTDRGQLIRSPVDDVRIAGRTTRGVMLFRVAADEKVVSVARLADDDAGNGDSDLEEQADGSQEPS